jgi:exonuclease III
MGMKQSDSDFFNAYDVLQNALGYEYSFFSPQVESSLAGRSIYLGQLILSKYPMARKSVIYMNGPLRKHSTLGRDDRNVHLLQYTRIDADGTIVNDLNYHGYFVYGTKMGNRTTESHTRKVLRYMDALNQDERIILAGDFNLAPKSKSLELINKSYSNLVLK